MALVSLDKGKLERNVAILPAAATLYDIILQLQGLKVAVVAGTTAVTNIAVTGILTTGVLKSVLRVASGVPTDVTSEASITSTGNIQLSTTNTTGNVLIVVWNALAGSGSSKDISLDKGKLERNPEILPSGATLYNMLLQLQGLKVALVTGATHAQNVTVTGIRSTDRIASVIRIASGVPSDVTSEASVTANDTIQLTTTDTGSDKLIVVYFSAAAGGPANLVALDKGKLERNIEILPSGATLYSLLHELQGLKISVGTGAGAASNIAITSIATTDTLRAVFKVAAGAWTDLTSEASITSAGNIQCSTTSTSGAKVVVIWYQK